MKKLSYLMCCLTIGSAAMMYTSAAKAQATDDDKKFLTEASQGSYDEIQLGKLAEEKAANPDVKAFGQRMVRDHTKLNAQMKPYAEQWGLNAPTACVPTPRRSTTSSASYPAATSIRSTCPTWSATTRRTSARLTRK